MNKTDIEKYIPNHLLDSFELSSRLQNMELPNVAGCSCNLYRVEDNCKSIAEHLQKALLTCAGEGAIGIDMSLLRPEGAPINGGRSKSSGVVSFSKMFDAVVHNMKRSNKVNNSGLLLLRYNHPEIVNFVNAEFDSLYKAVIMPRCNTEEARKLATNLPVAETIARWFNAGKCFLVQEPEDNRCINLCTEIEASADNICILGAHNIAAYDSLEEFEFYFTRMFRYSAAIMLPLMNKAYKNSADMGIISKVPPATEHQIGIGVFGLASFLGRLNITYRDLGEALEGKSSASKDAKRLAETLKTAYSYTADDLLGCVRAAFCIQPTVNTSTRVRDSEGFNVSPELQPVNGYQTSEGVSSVLISEVRGNKRINYHPHTWTMEQVNYRDYAYLSSQWQQMMNRTGLAHRHSHCFYGKEFAYFDLFKWLTDEKGYGAIKSLYYRLPEIVKQFDKTDIGSDNKLETDFDLDALLNGGYCSNDSECSSCSM